MKISIINGPNLNLLGTREPEVYGSETLQDIDNTLKQLASKAGIEVETFQSNIEGELINEMHRIRAVGFDGVIINAAAYTHTSIALHDAIKAIAIPVIEVHMSNVHEREEFRHKSCISPACKGVICGFGSMSYVLALQYFMMKK